MNNGQHPIAIIAYFTLLAVVLATTRVSAQETTDAVQSPDPKALMLGARLARLSVPSGVEEWEVSVSYPDEAGRGRKRRVSTVFAGDNLRIIHRHVIGSTEGDDVVSPMSHYVAINDETFLFNDDETDRAVLADRRDADSTLPIFDPRTLGATSMLFGRWEGIDQILPRSNETDVELVGADNINGKDCWHVRTTTPKGWKTDYWISDRKGFHIFQVAQWQAHRSSQSEYAPNGAGSALPIKVVYRTFAKDNTTVTREVTYRRLSFEYDVDVDPATFTFAKMGVPPGEAIVDQRIKQRIGYWDGAKITPRWPPEPPMMGTMETAETADNFWRRSIIAINVIVIAILMAFIYVRYHRNATSKA